MKSGRRNVSEDDPETIGGSRLDDGDEESLSKIPMELIIEIFSRLSLNSIARCRSVSKQWASILRRTDFTDLFLTRSLARPKLSIAFVKRGEFLFFSSSPQPPPRENVSSLITIDHHVSFPIERVEHISTPLNGFFCISDTRMILKEGSKTRESVWKICNPSTRQSFTLPKMKTVKRTKLTGFLGYDPIEKQHKVLAMTRENDRGVEHQVLTLGCGNLRWRMAECAITHSFPRRECLCINGVLYYTAMVSYLVHVIICFDVRSEKYSFVNAPDDERGLLGGKLINFLGKLALVTQPRYPFPLKASISLKMWILEDAEKHEWSKRIFKLPPICKDAEAVVGNNVEFVGVTAANEFVFAHDLPSDPFHVYYYDFVKEAITRVEIQGFGVFGNVSTARVCLNHVEDVKIMELF